MYGSQLFLYSGLCSHSRATQYFVNSIREPFLFPAVNCASVEECNQEIATTDQVDDDQYFDLHDKYDSDRYLATWEKMPWVTGMDNPEACSTMTYNTVTGPTMSTVTGCA